MKYSYSRNHISSIAAFFLITMLANTLVDPVFANCGKKSPEDLYMEGRAYAENVAGRGKELSVKWTPLLGQLTNQVNRVGSSAEWFEEVFSAERIGANVQQFEKYYREWQRLRESSPPEPSGLPSTSRTAEAVLNGTVALMRSTIIDRWRMELGNTELEVAVLQREYSEEAALLWENIEAEIKAERERHWVQGRPSWEQREFEAALKRIKLENTLRVKKLQEQFRRRYQRLTEELLDRRELLARDAFRWARAYRGQEISNWNYLMQMPFRYREDGSGNLLNSYVVHSRLILGPPGLPGDRPGFPSIKKIESMQAALTTEVAPGSLLAELSTTEGNEVEFLLDGKEFFNKFYQELKRIKNSRNERKYIHIAFWNADRRMAINGFGTSSPITIEDELRSAAISGAEVKVILWKGTPMGSVASGASGSPTEANEDFYKSLDTGAGGNIKVRLESYGSTILMSQHQKIAIFSEADETHVIVSGENLSDFYQDEPGHAGNAIYEKSGYFGTIHDTALWFRGPATCVVEAEWFRRWKKVEPGFLVGKPSPTKSYPADVAVHIATTDDENNQTGIQTALLSAVRQAEDYIYLENFGIIYDSLIRAVTARLRKNPALKVIFNIPAPGFSDANRAGEINGRQRFKGPYGYLHYLSYIELALKTCTNVSFERDGGSVTRYRADYPIWRVNWSNDGLLEDSELEYGSPPPRQTVKVPLTDISGIGGGIQFYTPVRATSNLNWHPVYIHSKLGLVDDNIAIVGSANFNYRSMLYDGELSAFIINTEATRNIKRRLFREFGMTEDHSRWHAIAKENERKFFLGQAKMGTIYILPVKWKWYERRNLSIRATEKALF